LFFVNKKNITIIKEYIMATAHATRLTPADATKYLSLFDVPQHLSGEERKDLLVGQEKSLTLSVPNEESLRFKNIVILGELIISSSDPENTIQKATIYCENFFISGRLNAKNVNIKVSELLFQGKDHSMLKGWFQGYAYALKKDE
jgi:hypothetical protein